jgi:hypothetical protein
LEIEQVEKALEGLTPWERYVVGIKYFDNLSWRNIEVSFNKQFPQKNDLTDERLKQINGIAIGKLTEILEPFYTQYESILKLPKNYTKITRKLPVSRNGKCYTIISGSIEK